jgi:hypothetical protein
MSARKPRDIGVLWCGNARQKKSNGWSFPPAVNRHLRELTKGKRVCHLFGGRAKWGVRCDIDPTVRPHVLGDAWLPPFVKDAFDVIILDPPYLGINQQMKHMLLRQAAYIARESVFWFHTQWVAADTALVFRRGWLVRVGDSCAVRCLQEFTVRPGEKRRPEPRFTRGPALRYNRWLAGQMGLPLREDPRTSVVVP